MRAAVAELSLSERTALSSAEPLPRGGQEEQRQSPEPVAYG
jgi:hypothetical protein